MTDSLVALLLLAFIAINFITFSLFARSHKRVAFRQPALSPSLLSSCAILGGGVAAFIATQRFRNIDDRVLDKRVIAILAVAQAGILAFLVFVSLSD